MSRGRSGRRGCLGRIVVAALALGLLAGGALFFFVQRPYQGFSGEVVVDIPRGTSTSAIADRLASEGVVQNRWLFLLARTMRGQATLQAGEYRFAGPQSPWSVVGK